MLYFLKKKLIEHVARRLTLANVFNLINIISIDDFQAKSEVTGPSESLRRMRAQQPADDSSFHPREEHQLQDDGQSALQLPSKQNFDILKHKTLAI